MELMSTRDSSGFASLCYTISSRIRVVILQYEKHPQNNIDLSGCNETFRDGHSLGLGGVLVSSIVDGRT